MTNPTQSLVFPLGNWRDPARPTELTRDSILVVDDEPSLRESTVLLLAHEGREITQCGTGTEALALIEQRDVDLILLDLNLPDISGIEVMAHLRRLPSKATVIVISADRQIDSAIQSLRNGVYEFLRKPFKPEQLERVVENALHERRLVHSHTLMSARLEQSEHLHRFLVDQSPDIIYTLDEQGCFLFISGRVESLLGFDRKELIGKHFSSLLHDEDREVAAFAFAERRTGDRSSNNIEVRLRRKENNGYLHFDSRLIVTILSATGLYEGPQNRGEQRFVGTYGVARDITERKRAEELVSFHAYHDQLTGLPNRTLFRDRLTVALRQSKRRENVVAIVFLDLDRFKLVNDTYGHAEGDRLLKSFAERLSAQLRAGDTLARQGGDEFTIILPDLVRIDDAATIGEKIVEAMRAPFIVAEQEFVATVSMGISVFPKDGDSPEALIRNADLAMYHIKKSGKNSLAFFTEEMSQGQWDRIALENDLRRAHERGEFELAYQPQISVARTRMIGMEALLRWRHPKLGLLDPSHFLALAEEAGFINAISDWVLNEACRQLAVWHAIGHRGLRMSVNLSPREFERDDIVERVTSAIGRHQLAPGALEVEITENLLLQDADRVIDKVRTLRRCGVHVAIDDFGTRYSSLNYLRRFPVSSIKIDQSFIHTLAADAGVASIIRAFVGIADGFSLHLVAEGVETSAQVAALQDLGCDIMQGYHFLQPSKAQIVEDLLLTYPAVAE